MEFACSLCSSVWVLSGYSHSQDSYVNVVNVSVFGGVFLYAGPVMSP